MAPSRKRLRLWVTEPRSTTQHTPSDENSESESPSSAEDVHDDNGKGKTSNNGLFPDEQTETVLSMNSISEDTFDAESSPPDDLLVHSVAPVVDQFNLELPTRQNSADIGSNSESQLEIPWESEAESQYSGRSRHSSPANDYESEYPPSAGWDAEAQSPIGMGNISRGSEDSYGSGRMSWEAEDAYSVVSQSTEQRWDDGGGYDEDPAEWETQLASLLLFFKNSTEMDMASCYGMIHSSKAKVLDVAALQNNVNGASDSGHIELQLSFKEEAVFLIPSKTTIEAQLAVINEETSKVLKTLSSLDTCSLKVYTDVDSVTSASKRDGRSNQMTIFPIDIIIYGEKAIRQSVGSILSSARMYLQHPFHQEPNTYYDNPHFLKATDVVHPLGKSFQQFPDFDSPFEDSDVENVSPIDGIPDDNMPASGPLQRKVAGVFNSLTRFKSLKRLEADVRITTPLQPHQEEALDFMSQREFGPISEEYSMWTKFQDVAETFYEHKITRHRTDDIPIETIGGILADDMGLGKTLSVLATIIRSSEAAKLFGMTKAKENPPRDYENTQKKVFSRATFVIVPSSTIIEVWLKEIEKRCAGSLCVNIYHGRGREIDPIGLGNSDIVLSTYHTVAAEVLDTQSPLKYIVWFRIVLDEAHIIRQMKTKLFQSVAKLSSKYRWCLTGTPIQNSLEDLAALVSFIGSHPLNNMVEFRKHIATPMSKETAHGVQNLRVLLDSICLRRTKKLLNLPRVVKDDRYVNFSPSERSFYIKTQADMIAAIKQHDSRERNSKNYFGVFQLQLQLRRLCNHGTFQKAFSCSEASNEDMTFDHKQMFDILRNTDKSSCLMCKTSIKGMKESAELGTGTFTACGHLLCLSCFSRYTAEVSKSSKRGVRCPLCKGKLSMNNVMGHDRYFGRLPMSIPEADNLHGRCTSSKMAALILDIQNTPNEGKSIVFSCWTRSLDLAAHFLTLEQIKFARLDGTCTLSERQRILDDFDEESDTRILLMTTGTGAVGLNLTVANRVYILEPQWNPMVENQAVGRVLRMGQGRDVKVIRYSVKGTIEEGIRSQQWRKLGFAKMGWSEEPDPLDVDAGVL